MIRNVIANCICQCEHSELRSGPQEFSQTFLILSAVGSDKFGNKIIKYDLKYYNYEFNSIFNE